MAPKKQKEKIAEHICVLCQADTSEVKDAELKYGKLLSDYHGGGKISAHYFCLLFACNLSQAAAETKGMLGFLTEDVIRERNRGAKLTCCFCNKKGATTACCNSNCKKAYHFPCAFESLKEGVQFIFHGNFESYCQEHRIAIPPYFKLEKLQERIDPLTGKKMFRIDCSACKSAFDLRRMLDAKLRLNYVQCQHCAHLAHARCVRKFASNAGLTHFKCANCNCNSKLDPKKDQSQESAKCQENYVKQCQLQGIYVPDKDAEWELNAQFADQYQEHDRCDAKVCVCKKFKDDAQNRKYDEIDDRESDWFIALCKACAGHGCHRKCGQIADVKEWLCDACQPVLKPKETGKKEDSPKKRPDSTKGDDKPAKIARRANQQTSE